MTAAPVHAEGRVIDGRYRLVRPIGQGGMATVWEAEHQTLGSPVAIKLLRWTARESPPLRERFLREARLSASVRHRNVVAIEDFGLDAGTPYIVMELLQGETLADVLARGPLEPREAARLVALALRGLSAVHAQGIVHRDLKPANVFVVKDPDGTYPKLLDFGVCRVTGSGDKSLTQEGTILGTPEYMSPEQARGRRGVDQRTDIYSMGVILYEALTGRLPHESRNVGDLLVKVSCDPPTPIVERNPTLSPLLTAIVDRAIDRDPNGRYPTAREMREELIEAFHGEGFAELESGIVTNPRARAVRADAETVALGAPPEPPSFAGEGRERARVHFGWMLLLAAAGSIAAALLYP